MEGKPHFSDGSEERSCLWIILLQDSVEMLGAMRNTILDSSYSPVQSGLQQRSSNSVRVNPTILPPPCFVDRVDPSNGKKFWRKVTPHIQELSDEGDRKL